MKRFELTDATKEHDGHTLHRIKALIDMSMHDVKAGDLGGWIEKEDNLQGDAWVADEAMIFEDALAYESALVFGDAKVYGDASVRGNALVYEHAKVYGNAEVFGSAKVYGNSRVYGNARVCGNSQVTGNAVVSGDAWVFGDANISRDAVVTSDRDYIVFKNFWSSGRYFTWTKSNNMWKVGCFYGTGGELIKKAYQDSEESGMWYSRFVNLVRLTDEKENINPESVVTTT